MFCASSGVPLTEANTRPLSCHFSPARQEASDPRSLQPAIAKPMRDAAELLHSHAPSDLAYDRLHGLLDAIEAPYDTRTQR
jgi:hypothetical protein